MQLPSDAEVIELVKRAQLFDEAAFDALYLLYADAIFHYFVYRADNQQTAEDLTSEVFLRMVEHLPRFVLPDTAPALAWTSWLFRIASNQLRDYRRRTKRPLVELDERLPSPQLVSDSIDRQLEYEEVRQALEHLTKEQQYVLLLRFVEELSLEDVAAMTGQTVGGVKSMQHRALKSLGRLLQQV